MSADVLSNFQQVRDALYEKNETIYQSDVVENQVPSCFHSVLELPQGHPLRTCFDIVRSHIPPDYPSHAAAYLAVCYAVLRKWIQEDLSLTENAGNIRNIVYLLRLALQDCSQGLVSNKGLELLQLTEPLFDSPQFSSFGIETCDLVTDILYRLRAPEWKQPIVQRSVHRMLLVALNSGAKIRKHVMLLVSRLYGGEKSLTVVDSTCTATCEFFIHLLESTVPDSSHFRCLQLMQVILPFFPRKEILASLKRLNGLLESQHVVIMQLCYAVYASVLRAEYERSKNMKRKEDDSLQDVKKRLLDEDIREILQGLIQLGCPPRKVGVSGVLGYVWSLSFGINCMEEIPAISIVCSLLEKLLDCLETASWMKEFASSYVSKALERSLFMLGQQFPFVLCSTAVTNIFCQLTSVRFETIFKDACHVLSSFVGFLVKHCVDASQSSHDAGIESCIHILQQLVEVRYHWEREQKDDSFLQLLNNVFASCLKQGGASYLLQVVSCHVGTHLENAWLLDLLCKYTRFSSLQLFGQKILPLYEELAKKIFEATQNGMAVQAKNFRMQQLQIWNAFAAFCRDPMEVDDGLLRVRNSIISVLKGGDADSKIEIVRGFRNVCQSVVSGNSSSRVVSNAMKELLPILFRLCFECSKERRNLVLETITLGAKVSSSKLVAEYLQKVMKQLLDVASEIDESKRDPSLILQRSIWLQISIALMEAHVLPVESPELNLLQKALLSHLSEADDGFLQKKSYRAFLDMLKMGQWNVACQQLEQEMTSIRELFQKLVQLQDSVAPGCRALRISCLTYCLLQLLKQDFFQAVPMVLTELIFCTKDQSAKIRNAAHYAVLEISKRYKNEYSIDNTDSMVEIEQTGLQEIFKLISAGLAGRSTRMLAATMVTMGFLIYEYRGEILMSSRLRQLVTQLFLVYSDTAASFSVSDDSSDISGYPGPVCLLLQHPSNEVVRAALNLIKIVVTVLRNPDDLVRIVSMIMSRMTDVAADSKEDIRRKVKVILERLLRKLGAETVQSLIPREHEPLFRNIRKTWERNMRQASMHRKRKTIIDEPMTLEEILSDTDEDRTDSIGLSNRQEASLDLNSSSKAQQRALNNKEVWEHKNKVNEGPIKYTDTGRIVITEEEEDDGLSRKANRWKRHGSIESLKTPRGAVKRSANGNDVNKKNFSKRHRFSKETETGKQYRSLRAKGDMQKSGRPEPFAYIPLQFSIGRDQRSQSERKNALRQFVQKKSHRKK